MYVNSNWLAKFNIHICQPKCLYKLCELSNVQCYNLTGLLPDATHPKCLTNR